MVQSIATAVSEKHGPLISQVITWITVAIVVPLALMNGYQFAAIIVVLFAFSGLREYRAAAARRSKREHQPSGPEPAPPAAPAPSAPPAPKKPPPEFPI
jgi:4-hydroxybenzoate polyprenyltransferase